MARSLPSPIGNSNRILCYHCLFLRGWHGHIRTVRVTEALRARGGTLRKPGQRPFGARSHWIVAVVGLCARPRSDVSPGCVYAIPRSGRGEGGCVAVRPPFLPSGPPFLSSGWAFLPSGRAFLP